MLKTRLSFIAGLVFLGLFTYGSATTIVDDADHWWFPDFLMPVAEVWPGVLLFLMIVSWLYAETEKSNE